MNVYARRQIAQVAYEWYKTNVFRTQRWAELRRDCPGNGICLSLEGWGRKRKGTWAEEGKLELSTGDRLRCRSLAAPWEIRVEGKVVAPEAGVPDTEAR